MSDWTNDQTRRVALWMDNEQATYEQWTQRATELLEDHECDKDAAAADLAEEMKCEFTEEADGSGLSGALAELLTNALEMVHWGELADHYLADIEVWVARWNLPGCMPEMDPLRVTDFDAARECIVEELNSLDEGEFTDEEQEEFDAVIAIVESAEAEFSVQYGNYVYVVDKL